MYMVGFFKKELLSEQDLGMLISILMRLASEEEASAYKAKIDALKVCMALILF